MLIHFYKFIIIIILMKISPMVKTVTCITYVALILLSIIILCSVFSSRYESFSSSSCSESSSCIELCSSPGSCSSSDGGSSPSGDTSSAPGGDTSPAPGPAPSPAPGGDDKSIAEGLVDVHNYIWNNQYIQNAKGDLVTRIANTLTTNGITGIPSSQITTLVDTEIEAMIQKAQGDYETLRNDNSYSHDDALSEILEGITKSN